MTPLIFLGAGPFSEQVEVARDINSLSPTYEILGILDDNKEVIGTTIESTPVLGNLASVKEYPHAQFVLGIGTNKSREQLAEIVSRLALPLNRYEILIHPTAKIYSSVEIGAGSIIHAGTVIGNGTKICPLVRVIWNSVVGADNVIGQGTSICPNATTCSGVKIGPYSFIASAVSIADNVNLGPMVKIGLGTVITRNIDAGAFMLGNPPKMIQKIDVSTEILEGWEKTVMEHR